MTKMSEKSEKEKPQKETKTDFEKKVFNLSKTGLTSEKIGEALRKEGIHSSEYGKISHTLKKSGSYEQPDLKNVSERLEKIEKHIEKNKQDKRAIRERSRIFSQLRRLKNYHGI